MRVGFCSMFRCTLLYVHSSFAIILMGKRDLVTLLSFSSWCLVMVVWLFLAVPWVRLQFVIVVFPYHTNLLFLNTGNRTFQDVCTVTKVQISLRFPLTNQINRFLCSVHITDIVNVISYMVFALKWFFNHAHLSNGVWICKHIYLPFLCVCVSSECSDETVLMCRLFIYLTARRWDRYIEIKC